jgi:GNAT superfamily N-acetyltransferase
MAQSDPLAYGTELTIRAFEDGDAGAVSDLFVEINRELAPEAMSLQFESYMDRSRMEEIDRVREYYGERGGGFWVAVRGGTLVGMFGLERTDDDTFELRRMYVRRAARRTGLGRRLLALAEAAAAEKGARRLTLSTSELQTAALSLYRAAGYREVLTEKVFATSNRTVGGGLTRHHFEKRLFQGFDSVGKSGALAQG